MSCVLAASADFRESEVGQAGVRRQLKRGDIFVTRSKTPYELDWKSPVGEELDFIIIHLALRISLRNTRTPLRKSPNTVEVCRSGSSGKWRTMAISSPGSPT
jgi:hypothetical protein